MIFKPSDASQFPRVHEYRPFVEWLVDGLRDEGETNNSRARVRAAVALGLLPVEELVRVNPATAELDPADRCALQIRDIFTGEVTETHTEAGEPSPPAGSYLHLRRGGT